MKKKLLLTAFGFLLALLVAGGYFWYLVNRPNVGGSEVIRFEVEKGQSVTEISENLAKQDLIISNPAFILYTQLTGLSSNLQAGTFYIAGNLSVAEVASVLQHGTDDVRLTFIEGWRREQYALYLSDEGHDLVNDQLADQFLRFSEGLEGYLFPDTYLVGADISGQDLVGRLKNTFGEKAGETIQTSLNGVGLSEKQVLIFASIVEKEAKFEEDRPLVAGILVKRFKNGWPLEADATVQYAMVNEDIRLGRAVSDWWPSDISNQDLQIDSPYNTRLVTGLPPGPICNPGLASIEAVLNYAETDYWYYLSDLDGKMHYARTLPEHNQNIARYLSE